MRQLYLAGLIALVVMGGMGASKMHPHGDEQAIRQAEADFEAARAAKGLEGWLSFFADDATDIAAGAPIADKTAMRARLKKRWNNFVLKWQPVKVKVARGGDMAFSVGTWQIADKNKPSAGVIGRGKYLTVWGKQKDGSWKVLADTGVEDPAAQK